MVALVLGVWPCCGVETEVSDGKGRFNDEPSMARAADGSLYVAWNGFRDGDDALMIARYQFKDGKFRKLGAWEALAGKGTNILGPKVVAANNGVFVLYAAERERAWDIQALPCSAKGPGRAVAVAGDGAANIKPDGAWRDGTLWVTWETNRDGARRILLASLRDGRVSAPQEVSAAGRSNYGPSIAVESNGMVDVAWHSFRENNYDIYLRRRSAAGEWTPERRLTTAPTMDRHAALALYKDDLWVFYENSKFKGYSTGYSLERNVIAAKVTPRGLESPRNFGDARQRGEAASPAFDSAGRLWLAYLVPRLKQGWEVWFTGFNGEQWTPAKAISKVKGMDRKPALLIDGDTALLAFQTDDIFHQAMSCAEAGNFHSGILLASVDLRQAAPAASQMALAPLAESKEPFEAGSLRVQYGEDTPSPSIEEGGRKLRLLFGDLHTHSDISQCQRCTNQSVDENYQVRRDLHNLDFACMTDHGYNQSPYFWNYTAKMARANEDPGRLTTFLAQEWTSEFKKGPASDATRPYGYYGHRNIILADPFFPRWWNSREGQTPADVWGELDKLHANFVNIPHQLADTGNVPTDWTFTNQTKQPVAEIFQGRGSYEYKGTARQAVRSVPQAGWFLQDAWARGTVIGVIASPDHGGGLGKACVYAQDASREAILDAIRARHTYGTTAARIFLEMRVNGHLMGDKIPAAAGQPVEVKVGVRCPGDIGRIEICRNNQYIYTKQPEGRTADFTFVDTTPLDGYSYYYVRVTQKDQEIAWSSPVWLGAK
jgi:hypothetical protein